VLRRLSTTIDVAVRTDGVLLIGLLDTLEIVPTKGSKSRRICWGEVGVFRAGTGMCGGWGGGTRIFKPSREDIVRLLAFARRIVRLFLYCRLWLVRWINPAAVVICVGT